MYFYNLLYDEMVLQDVKIGLDKWFTNLTSVGNIGSASIFVALEELFHSDKLQKGDKILLMVPESGRFSFGTALLTVA